MASHHYIICSDHDDEVCVLLHMCLYIYIYIYIHTHIHILYIHNWKGYLNRGTSSQASPFSMQRAPPLGSLHHPTDGQVSQSSLQIINNNTGWDHFQSTNYWSDPHYKFCFLKVRRNNIKNKMTTDMKITCCLWIIFFYVSW